MLIKIVDCQNRFSTETSKVEIAKPFSIKPNTSQMDQSSSTNPRGNRNLFEKGTYDMFAQSLFATAKACHQARNDVHTTQRKLLETFHAGLTRLDKDIDDKLKNNQK